MLNVNVLIILFFVKKCWKMYCQEHNLGNNRYNLKKLPERIIGGMKSIIGSCLAVPHQFNCMQSKQILFIIIMMI